MSSARSTYFDGRSRVGDRSNCYVEPQQCAVLGRETRRGAVRNRGIGDALVISKGRIAYRFNRTTQTRKATPASVWRTRCVIRRQLRALRIAPPATRVHLLWVKRRRGGCSFLTIVLYTSTLYSILVSVSPLFCLFIPFSFSLLLSHSHSVWWTSRLVCRSTAAHAKTLYPRDRLYSNQEFLMVFAKLKAFLSIV